MISPVGHCRFEQMSFIKDLNSAFVGDYLQQEDSECGLTQNKLQCSCSSQVLNMSGRVTMWLTDVLFKK